MKILPSGSKLRNKFFMIIKNRALQIWAVPAFIMPVHSKSAASCFVILVIAVNHIRESVKKLLRQGKSKNDAEHDRAGNFDGTDTVL